MKQAKALGRRRRRRRPFPIKRLTIANKGYSNDVTDVVFQALLFNDTLSLTDK